MPDLSGGHGHVWPRGDGAVARCGGPPLCAQCSQDAAWFAGVEAAERPRAAVTDHGTHLTIDWPGGRGPVLMSPELLEGNVESINQLRAERDHLTAELSREQGEGDPSWGDLASALHRALDAAALARAERDRARATAVRLEQELAECRADMGACDVHRPVIGRTIRVEVHGIEVDDPIEELLIDAACEAAEARGLDWFASSGPAYEMPDETKVDQ